MDLQSRRLWSAAVVARPGQFPELDWSHRLMEMPVPRPRDSPGRVQKVAESGRHKSAASDREALRSAPCRPSHLLATITGSATASRSMGEADQWYLASSSRCIPVPHARPTVRRIVMRGRCRRQTSAFAAERPTPQAKCSTPCLCRGRRLGGILVRHEQRRFTTGSRCGGLSARLSRR